MAGSRQATDEDSYTLQLLAKLAARGPRDTIVYGQRRLSGREVHDLILRYAGALTDLGVGEGDGVALFTVNTPETLLLTLAVHFLGGRLVFVPPEPGNGKLGSLIERAEVELLIFDPVFSGRAAQLAKEAQVVTYSLGPADGAPDFLAKPGPLSKPAPEDAAPASSVTTLFYTGGTTGQPKLVPHGHGFYERMVKAAGTHGSEAAEPRMVIGTLLSHLSGHFASLLALFSDQAVVLMPGETFDAGTALATLGREKATGLIVVPPMLYELLDHPDRPEAGFPDLERILYLGAPTAPARLLQAIEAFGPVLHQIYGATETGLVTELWPAEHDPRRSHLLQSCGKPGVGIEVELRDEHGAITEAGRIGELYIRSAMVTKGYWRDAERTRELKDGEWARSGDLGYRDDEGYLYLVDRSRDVIVTGQTSDNVYSRRLDDFLYTLPGIRQAAAVPDPEMSEAVHVFLVPQDGADLDLAAIGEQIAAELGDLYRPKAFTVTGSLPYTTVGKVDKKALRTAHALAQEPGSDTSPVGGSHADLTAALAELFYGDERDETLDQMLDRLVSPDFVDRVNGQVYDRAAYLPHVREMRKMVTGGGDVRVLEEIRGGDRIAGRYLFTLDTAGGRVQFESHLFAEFDDDQRITHLIEVARQTLPEDSSEMLEMTPAANRRRRPDGTGPGVIR